MSLLTAESKRAIEDTLAAIDLINEQRPRLEAALRRNQQPFDNGGAQARAVGRRQHHRKGPPTTLAILIDQHTIMELKAATGMVKAIEFIGVDRVEGLGLKLGGQPLIVRGAQPPGRGYRRCGDCWVATHSDTAEKRNVLEEICQRLGITGSIRQVPRHVPPDCINTP